MALTAVLSTFRLDGKGLWHDEAFTWAVANSNGDSFWEIVTSSESFAGLYYAIIRLFPQLSHSESTLRAPSVVFAVLAAGTLYVLGRRLFGAWVAAWSVLLLSIDFFFIRYAQEARAYSLVLWLVTMATLSLVRAVEQPSWRRWFAFGAISAVAVYAHFFAVLVLFALLGSLVLHRSLVPWKKVAGASALTTALVLPLATVVLSTNAGGRPLLPQTSITALLAELAGISPSRLGLLQAAALILCGAGVVLAYIRQRHQRRDSILLWRHTLVVCWLAVPITLGALVSLVSPVFVTRYFIVSLPALLLLLAVGVSVLRPVVQVAALLVLVVVGAHGLGIYYGQDHKEGENWRALVQHVALEAEHGDRMLFLSRFGRRPFEYYLDRHPGLASSLTPEYPSMPWGEYPPVVGEAEVGSTNVPVRELAATKPERIWVVLLWGGFRTGDDAGAPVQHLLTREYVETDHLYFGRYLKLGLFERASDPHQPTA